MADAILQRPTRSTDPIPARPAVVVTNNSDDAGKLLLRLLVGALVLLHGFWKLQHGVGPVTEALSNAGLPGQLAYFVYIGEVLAPLMLLFGVWTRAAALVVAINMVTALALVHRDQMFSLNEQGGWAIELQAMFLFGAIAVAILGAGRHSAGGLLGRWN